MVAAYEPDSGFTILEVLIALTVLAMSMAVLLAVFSQGLDRAHANGLRAQARDFAQALLAREETTPAKSLGNSNGQTGALSWQLNANGDARHSSTVLEGGKRDTTSLQKAKVN